ncbi:alpha/beta hydrolase fold domain-containing protein [Marinobacter lacisalsi]|uniref:Alpha/beta hydrolase fold domain-containing protein n=1 Tax=Marinobacter lacisalsi TaxID=475979 RepID=A0ABV8QFV8_9GAMM
MTFRIAPAVVLMLHGLFTGPAMATGIPPVELTVSGQASPELLADFRQALERMARRQPADDQSQTLPETEAHIDLDQFWKVEQDLSYTRDQESPRQRLNIIYPFEGEPPYRTIVHFHGGDWQSGSRRSAANAPAYWAIYQGYALVDVGYRLADEAHWPAQLHDAKAAIRYLRANAEEHELNAERIVVMGRAAGGHLAQMLAATNGDAAAEDPDMGYDHQSSDVQGVVSWAGVADITAMAPLGQPAADALMGYPAYQSDLALEASPVAQIHDEYPPILLIHGTNDQVTPFDQSARMAIRVNAVTGSPAAKLKLLIGAGHQLPGTEEVMTQSLDFVDGILFPEEDNPHRSSFFPVIQSIGSDEQSR